MAKQGDIPVKKSFKDKMKNVLANAAVLLVTTILMFGMGEVISRMMFKDQTVLFPRYHTNANYGEYHLRRLRPNATFWHTSKDGSWKFTTNAQGFRNDRDFSYEKPLNTQRIISLGDSHTQGFEVRQEHTYSAILDHELNKHGIQAEVINAGISGFSTAEALMYLENEGIKYDPDYVILGFFANDYQDNAKCGLFALEEGELVQKSKEYIPGVKIQNMIYSLPMVKWLGENSYFYSVLFNATWVFMKDLQYQAQEAGQDQEINSSQDNLEFAIATTLDFSEYEIQLTLKLIERMQAFCQKNDIQLIIIDIPQDGDDHAFSSFPQHMRKDIPGYCNEYIDSESLLLEFSGEHETHVVNGQRHISEFTHGKLGEAAAKYIFSQQHSLESLSSQESTQVLPVLKK